jgi:hypothetical protein
VVEVTYLETKVSEDEIRDRLRELGFKVEGESPEGKVRS